MGMSPKRSLKSSDPVPEIHQRLSKPKHDFERETKLKIMKESIETEGCTFRPEISSEHVVKTQKNKEECTFKRLHTEQYDLKEKKMNRII